MKQESFTGNLTHLDVLITSLENGSTELWNNWREENPSLQPDLSGLILCDDSRLSSIDFSYANLNNTSFEKSNLSLSNFTHAQCLNVDFNDAILHNSDFSHSKVSARFIMANLQNCNFSNTSFTDSLFMASNLSNCVLSNSYHNDVAFVDCTIDKMKCSHIFITAEKRRVPQQNEFTTGELRRVFTEGIPLDGAFVI